MTISEFIRQIPKADLHLHLDGSLRLSTLMALAESDGVPLPAPDEDGLRREVFKPAYADLGEYLRGFALTCAVLKQPGNLERVAYELAVDNQQEGVRYIEVRFAPQLLTSVRMSVEEAVVAVDAGLRRAQREQHESPGVRDGSDLPFRYGIILCAMRRFVPAMGDYYQELSRVMRHAPAREQSAAASLEMAREAVRLRDVVGLPVVGFDLAGEEAGYPAAYHRAAYTYAHRHFLKKTVHAGEAYGPESIFQALTDCHANRIGHGTFLFAADMVTSPEADNARLYVERLADYIATERITIEVCPTSNLQTVPTIPGMADHPLAEMLRRNLAVTICTDNRLVSNTTVSRELEQVASAIDLSRHQFMNLVLAGFKGSFFPGPYNEKRAYVRRFLNLYRKLERQWLGPGESDPARGEDAE